MKIARNTLLWCSQNSWMKANIPKLGFAKRAVKKFMPGEKAEDAIREAEVLKSKNIHTLFTHLGENINDLNEASDVTEHYLELLSEITKSNADSEISVKLTQIGFDLSEEETINNFNRIADKAKEVNNIVWIDMEQSWYVDRTIEFYKKAKEKYDHVGLCLQAYLYRTEEDLKGLLEISPMIRLVKGAYNEPADVAYPKKEDVDKNYFELSKIMLDAVEPYNLRPAIGTHDIVIINNLKKYAIEQNIHKDKVEFHMLFGIRNQTQLQLATEGFKTFVLISYGEFWYPWYVRRLAERPANIWFVIKNIFTK